MKIACPQHGGPIEGVNYSGVLFQNLFQNRFVVFCPVCDRQVILNSGVYEWFLPSDRLDQELQGRAEISASL
ncbi:MAG: hypothetical protein INR69_13710 [Mucilaginibacter polytrichastri]|nr:hypothetical protein [Mucilaginibacter polytrichastri]